MPAPSCSCDWSPIGMIRFSDGLATHRRPKPAAAALGAVPT